MFVLDLQNNSLVARIETTQVTQFFPNVLHDCNVAYVYYVVVSVLGTSITLQPWIHPVHHHTITPCTPSHHHILYTITSCTPSSHLPSISFLAQVYATTQNSTSCSKYPVGDVYTTLAKCKLNDAFKVMCVH